ELRIRGAAIAAAAAKLGHANGPDASSKVRIDRAQSREKHALVVSFGGGDKDSKGASGYAVWKLERLFDGVGLSDLVPDESQLKLHDASLTVARALDLSGLHAQGAISIAGW